MKIEITIKEDGKPVSFAELYAKALHDYRETFSPRGGASTEEIISKLASGGMPKREPLTEQDFKHWAGARVVEDENPRSPERIVEVLRSVNGNAVSDHIAELCRDAADCIEGLKRHSVIASGAIAFNGDKVVTVEALQKVFVAFADFSSYDWQYLLGEGEYASSGKKIAYRADRRGVPCFDAIIKNALRLLRDAVGAK